jgi:protein-S-isoprenylcysteine O-methyltransferase Ste14
MTQANPKISPLKLFGTFLYILFFPVLLLAIGGDWLWPEGLVFSGWFLVLCYSTIMYLYRHDPALLNERYKQPGSGNQSTWDKYVVIGLALGFTAWIIIMPLDAKRFAWTPAFPFNLKMLGAISLVFSYVFFYRAYKDNTYLSPLVRIQKDRKQKTVTTGVYALVRHPMYLAATYLFIGTPMLLGSVGGLLLGCLLVLLLMLRIIGEEKLLEHELENYRDYKLKVKYRLIPFVW